MLVGVTGTIFIIIGGTLVYLAPTLAAIASKSKRSGGIFILNLLTGWTLLGWIAALIWALASDKLDDAPFTVVNSVPISVADEISKLVQLHKDGVIKSDEFEAQKKALLNTKTPVSDIHSPFRF